MHLFGISDKEWPVTRRQIAHPHALAADADGVENLHDLLDPFPGPEIPAVEMAIAFPAANDVHAVGPFLKGPQNVEAVDFSGTGDPDNFDGRGVRHSHRTCQVRSGVPSEIAAKGDDDRLKVGLHKTPSSKDSTLHSI
jgi:hypothetical protein